MKKRVTRRTLEINQRQEIEFDPAIDILHLQLGTDINSTLHVEAVEEKGYGVTVIFGVGIYSRIVLFLAEYDPRIPALKKEYTVVKVTDSVFPMARMTVGGKRIIIRLWQLEFTSGNKGIKKVTIEFVYQGKISLKHKKQPRRR